MYQKIAKFLFEVFFGFFPFYYRLGTVSCQITFFQKLAIIWVFQRNFIFFLKIAIYQKIAKFSTLSTGTVSFRFFPLTPFRNSISKNSIIWVFQRNFMFFLKIAMYQKIAKFSTLSTGVKLQSQMEVFFDFFSFYYRLGTVSCQITLFQKTQ